MEKFHALFDPLPEYRIIRCKTCRYAVVPHQVKTHLAHHHARLAKGDRQSIIAAVESLSYLARCPTEVQYPDPSGGQVARFPICYDGLRCASKDERGVQCRAVYRTLYRIQQHCKQEHGWTNMQQRGGDKRNQEKQTPNKLWVENRACQQFFRASGWKRYFEVEDHAAENNDLSPPNELIGSPVRRFFQDQRKNMSQAKADAVEKANRVDGFASHRSTVVPWLRETGIVDHVGGLRKDEIKSAIALPSSEEETVLHTILSCMDEILAEARSWCSDGPDCMLTWPCRVVLSRFQSTQVELIGKTRAFAPHKDPGTLKAYSRTAKQFLSYVFRVAAARGYYFTPESDEARRPEDVIEMTDEQLRTWQTIVRLARKYQSNDEDTVQDELRIRLLEMWMLLICHNTGARRYRSALLSFCAMLSIRPSSLSWMEPGNFNSHLSAIIWVVQLLIFYDSARQEHAGQGKTLALVKRYCDEYLQQTVETPMGEILRWRLLLFGVSQETVGDRQATWDESENVLTFEGTELHMEHIPTLLVSEFIECRRLLYEDLMFGLSSINRMHAWALKDNPDVEVVGWNFTSHQDNAQLLRGADEALLRAIERSESLCRLYITDANGRSSRAAWRESAVASYETTVQEFLKRMCTLFHISSGQPIRESEFFSMTWCNTQRRRSITLRHERVMVHVKYHKGLQQTGKHKDNIRFLAHPLGDLLLDYIVYVLPLRQIFLRQGTPGATLSPFLWEKDGKVWPESRLTHCLEGASTRAGIPRLHISNWRQMTVAIVKTKFAGQVECFEADEEDEDAEEMEANIRIMTRQRNHKTQTVNRAYANQSASNFGNVWDGLIRMGLRASILWQDFWGVETIMNDKKRKRGHDDSSLTKRVAMGVYRPRRPWSSDSLLEGLRRLYKRDNAEWKSAEQGQALTTIMSWTGQVVAMLPTGGGKSLLFMLPCTLPDAGITIVVVPLVALRTDLMRRVQELQIDYLEWLPGEKREATLVFVSVEAASSSDFLKYAQSLVAQQKLDRIVVDECHLTVTAAEYRSSIVDLTAIRRIRTQFVYLTATLPPSMQPEFEERNYLLRPTTIRASSNRSNIFYMVRRIDGRKGKLPKQAAAEAREAWEESGLFNHARDKIVLYVRTRDQAEELAGLLACDPYTAGSGTVEDKKQILERWVTDPSRPYLVATTALAEGFDYPHVRLVINVDEPESLIVFAQESGRAGRDGQRAYSMVLLASTWNPKDNEEPPQTSAVSSRFDRSLRNQRDRWAVHQYLRGQQCYRTSLTECLDAPHHRRWCYEEDVPCDVCKQNHENALPPKEAQRTKSECTGLDLIQRERLRAHVELEGYVRDLAAVRGSCLLCRAMDERWDHPFSRCSQRFRVFEERKKTRQRHEASGRDWLQPYTACFWCLNPQSICERAVPERGVDPGACEDGDVVLPLAVGIFYSIGGQEWIQEHFGQEFSSIEKYFDWLGEESEFGGERSIQAVRVAGRKFEEFR